MRHAVLEQMQELPSASRTSLDLLSIVGKWVNTNPSPALIRGIQLEPAQHGLSIRVTGADPELPQTWGQSEAQPFAENSASGEAMAFSALFELDGVQVRLQGYVVKGVLVIVSFLRVKDARNRSSHFGKEFFYRVS